MHRVGVGSWAGGWGASPRPTHSTGGRAQVMKPAEEQQGGLWWLLQGTLLPIPPEIDIFPLLGK